MRYFLILLNVPGNMKKYLPASLAICLLVSVKLFAQQNLVFSQYMFNKMIYNPAAAGSDTGYITAKGLFQDQWLGFHDPEGATSPISVTGSIDAPIRLKSKQFYLGAGLTYSHYSIGFIQQNEYLVSASCHYLPSFGGDLSFGINSGIVNEQIAPNWSDVLIVDPYLPSSKTNNGFNAGVGLYYSTKDYYIGISALNIPQTNLDWLGGSFPSYSILSPVYTVSGGYNFYINHNKNLELQPSFFLEDNNVTYSYAVSCLFLYKQRFWAGLDFKANNATSSSVMAGVIFLKGKLGDARVGASYAYVTSAPVEFGGILELTMSARIKI